MRQIVLLLYRWFPTRRFRFAGDTTYSTHVSSTITTTGQVSAFVGHCDYAHD
jgi:hypothetical protein